MNIEVANCTIGTIARAFQSDECTRGRNIAALDFLLNKIYEHKYAVHFFFEIL